MPFCFLQIRTPFRASLSQFPLQGAYRFEDKHIFSSPPSSTSFGQENSLDFGQQRRRQQRSRDRVSSAPYQQTAPYDLSHYGHYEGSYLFEGLRSGTEYKVKLRTRNQFGWSDEEARFTFRTSLTGTSHECQDYINGRAN